MDTPIEPTAVVGDDGVFRCVVPNYWLRNIRAGDILHHNGEAVGVACIDTRWTETKVWIEPIEPE
jgi:hypothetical protein